MLHAIWEGRHGVSRAQRTEKSLQAKGPREFYGPLAWQHQSLGGETNVHGELWTEVCDIVQGAVIKTIQRKRSTKKQNGCLGRAYK